MTSWRLRPIAPLRVLARELLARMRWQWAVLNASMRSATPRGRSR